MHYYLGVDWADQTHAVWVGDERGTKITARTVPHTAEGLSEWGRELDEWRAQGLSRARTPLKSSSSSRRTASGRSGSRRAWSTSSRPPSRRSI